MSHVIRNCNKTESLPNFAKSASQIECIDCLLEELLSGKVVIMSDVEKCYWEICHSKCVKDKDMIFRKPLKALIKSERIMLKSVSDALILHSEETCNLNNNLKIIY